MASLLPSLHEGVRLAPPAVAALRADDRRIVIVGAGGWIGRALLAGLHDALDHAASEQIVCFGSAARYIDIGDGRVVPQRALAELTDLPHRPTLLFHLAFLTKDKAAGMDAADYRRDNRALSRRVFGALEPIGVDRLFLASSGAAAFADNVAAAPDLRLYGSLKREDEDLFSDWANTGASRRALIMRIHSLAGPFINKHETYAFASLVLDALSGRPITVTAPMRVERSYVAVREILSLATAALLAPEAPALRQLDSGGEALELGELAQRIAAELGGQVKRPPLTSDCINTYVGNCLQYNDLLSELKIDPVTLDAQIRETAGYLAGHVRSASS
jgi:nucleoside-diphosphate-sugar epimerase